MYKPELKFKPTSSEVVLPEIRIYVPEEKGYRIFRGVHVDDYFRKKDGKPEDFSFYEAIDHNTPSLPVLIAVYCGLAGLADSSENAYNLLQQMNHRHERSATFLDDKGCISHEDLMLGRVSRRGLHTPLRAGPISELFQEYPSYFQILLGVKDPGLLIEEAEQYRLSPYFIPPNHGASALFGGWGNCKLAIIGNAELEAAHLARPVYAESRANSLELILVNLYESMPRYTVSLVPKRMPVREPA